MGWFRALISKFYYAHRQQFGRRARQEMVAEGIGEAGRFQVVDDGVPFRGDGRDIAGRGHLAPL